MESVYIRTCIGGTCWLSHCMRAITIFLKSYTFLRYQLEHSSHDNAKTEGLARILRDGHVFVYMIAMQR